MNLVNSIWNQPKSILQDLLTRSSEAVFSTHQVSTKFSLTNLFRLFQYVYLIYWIYRFLLGGILWSDEYRLYAVYDYFLATLFKLQTLNAVNSLCTALIPAFAIFIDYIVHFQRFNYVWQLPAEVILIDCERFFLSNPQFIPKIDLLRPIASIQSVICCAQMLWSLPLETQVNLQQEKLRFYPNVPQKLRVRTIFTRFVLNLGTTVATILLIVLLTALNIFVAYYCLAMSDFSWYISAAFIAEAAFISYCTLNAVRNLLFAIQAFACIGLLTVCYINHLNQSLDVALFAVKRHRITSGQFRAVVSHYRREHSIMLLDAIISNSQLLSPILLAAVTSNITLSMYEIIERLHASVHSIGDLAIDTLLLCAQGGFVAVTVVPMIWLTNVLFHPSKRLFTAQIYLNSSNGRRNCRMIRTKFTIAVYLEKVYCNQRRFAYTIGPFGKITLKFMLEFLIFYSGYFMFMYGLLRSEKKFI